MLSIEQYIEKKLKLRFPETYQSLASICQRQIDEAMTKSYNVDSLIRKISKHYGLPLEAFGISAHKDGDAHPFLFPKNYGDIYIDSNDEWLNKILLFYGYYISEGYNDAKNIKVEPIYTKNITDKIYDDCKGAIYVLMNKEYYENEMKSKKYIDPDNDIKFSSLLYKIKYRKKEGLPYRSLQKDLIKLKGKDPYRITNIGSRKVTSRKYFFAGPTKKALQHAFKEITQELTQYVEKDYIVIKIDLKKSGYNVSCYRDEYNFLDGTEDFYVLYINAIFTHDMIEKIISATEFKKEIGLDDQ